MSDRTDSDTAEPRPAVYERINDAMFALDEDWQFTYLNQRAERLLDVDKESLIGRTIWSVLPEQLSEAFKNQCLEAFTSGSPVQFEQSSPTTDDWLSVRIYPSDTGLTVCFRAVESDHDQGFAERHRQAIAESITDATVTVGPDGVIKHSNSALGDIFGYTQAELLGEPLTILIPERLREQHELGLERYLDTGERQLDWRGIELPGLRKDGEEIDLHISFSVHEQAGETWFTGIIRDITDRNRRELAMQEAYETVSSGKPFKEKVQTLLEIGCWAVGTEYGTLSKGERETNLFDTVVAPEDADLEAGDTIDLAATNCEHAMRTRETLVLNDIAAEAPELSDRAGNAEWGMACYLGTPIIVDDEAIGTFCFYDMEPRAREFDDWQVAFVEYLGRWVEEELERKRYLDRLSALNDLNKVVHEITSAAIDQSTREEIESQVCEALADTNSYQFAWVGEPNPQTQEVELRVEAGVEGYLDDVIISTDPDAAESQGPTGRALRRGEVQTTQRVITQAAYEPWWNTVEEYGYRSSAAIPIEHEGTNYGVLNLYTTRTDAFEEEERAVVGLLGKIIGHAIAAADRKQALLSDSVVELELRAAGAVTELGIPEIPTGNVVLEAAVPRGDDEYVVFGTAEAGDLGFVEGLLESQDHWQKFLHVDKHDCTLSFEVLIRNPPIMSKLASVGGRFVEAEIGANDLRIRFQLPHSADVSRTIDAVRGAYPNTSLVSKHETITKRMASREPTAVALDQLTDRQVEALRTAYHAGYFDWPRGTSGEDVATMLDIASATFSQHLRGAERAVFRNLLEDRHG